jgi:hypothetical protein
MTRPIGPETRSDTVLRTGKMSRGDFDASKRGERELQNRVRGVEKWRRVASNSFLACSQKCPGCSRLNGSHILHADVLSLSRDPRNPSDSFYVTTKRRRRILHRTSGIVSKSSITLQSLEVLQPVYFEIRAVSGQHVPVSTLLVELHLAVEHEKWSRSITYDNVRDRNPMSALLGHLNHFPGFRRLWTQFPFGSIETRIQFSIWPGLITRMECIGRRTWPIG